MLLISACLLGAKVKYNGSSNYCTLLAKYKDCGLYTDLSRMPGTAYYTTSTSRNYRR